MEKRSLYNVARFVKSRLTEMGIDVSRTRLGRMVSLLDAPDLVTPASDGFHVARQGLKDIQEFGIILETLCPVSAGAALTKRIRHALRDPALPSERERHSPGRNAQVELLVEAIGQRGGLRPQYVNPPDFFVTVGSERWALEAKRLRSLASFEKRLRQAFRGIEKTQVPGVAIIDISFALHKHDTQMSFTSEAHRNLWWSRALHRFASEYDGRIQAWRAGRSIRGILLLDHMFGCPRGATLGFEALTFRWPLDKHNQRRRREFELFCSAFCSGTATPCMALLSA